MHLWKQVGKQSWSVAFDQRRRINFQRPVSPSASSSPLRCSRTNQRLSGEFGHWYGLLCLETSRWWAGNTRFTVSIETRSRSDRLHFSSNSRSHRTIQVNYFVHALASNRTRSPFKMASILSSIVEKRQLHRKSADRSANRRLIFILLTVVILPTEKSIEDNL